MAKRIFSRELIAPCGMNCGVCIAHLREKKACCGCWGDDKNKSKSCVGCIIKNCEYLVQTKSKFCYDCDKYPCARLKQLDKRYRTGYKTSLLGNLEIMKIEGITGFLKKEEEKWKCAVCGAVLCVHRTFCLKCKHPIN